MRDWEKKVPESFSGELKWPSDSEVILRDQESSKALSVSIIACKNSIDFFSNTLQLTWGSIISLKSSLFSNLFNFDFQRLFFILPSVRPPSVFDNKPWRDAGREISATTATGTAVIIHENHARFRFLFVITNCRSLSSQCVLERVLYYNLLMKLIKSYERNFAVLLLCSLWKKYVKTAK